MFIGTIISNRRKELKMTQKELAEKLNVTDRTVSRWECGVNLPDVEMLKTISKVLDVDITYFYEDVSTREINYTEEYDYDKIKKFKIKSIVPFVLISFSILFTLILKNIMLEITMPLGFFSNIESMIHHAFTSGIMQQAAIIMSLLGISFAITVLSICLYLNNSISFKCFYKEKMFQTAYIETYKKTNIIYLILFALSILFILF